MHGVIVYFRRDFKGIGFPIHKFEKLVRSLCRRFKINKALVDIAVVDNNRMRKLNKQFLNRKTATDVIAFDLTDHGEKRKIFSLVVNAQKAKSEALKRNHSPQAELALYITHGLLHNLGFNDNTPAQAQKMHVFEDEILRRHGFGPVYEKNVE
jgi:probable rRNA maturation factor